MVAFLFITFAKGHTRLKSSSWRVNLHRRGHAHAGGGPDELRTYLGDKSRTRFPSIRLNILSFSLLMGSCPNRCTAERAFGSSSPAACKPWSGSEARSL